MHRLHRFADDFFDSHFFALRFAVGSQCPKFDSQTAMRYWVNYSLHNKLLEKESTYTLCESSVMLYSKTDTRTTALYLNVSFANSSSSSTQILFPPPPRLLSLGVPLRKSASIAVCYLSRVECRRADCSAVTFNFVAPPIVENARQSHTWQGASGHVRSRSEECIWRVLGGWRKFKKNHSLLFSIAS